VQPRARLLCLAGEDLVEVEPGAHQAVAGVGGQLGPGQLQAHPPAEDAQAAVVQPAGLLARVDPHTVQLADRPRGEPVAADLLAREGGLVQQQHVQPGLGKVVGGGRPGRPGPHHDDVGVLPGAAGGRAGCHGWRDLAGRRTGDRERFHEVAGSSV
jgi:hypothetical protein